MITLEEMRLAIQRLGPVWRLSYETPDEVTLEPGGPWFTDEQFSEAEAEIGYKLPPDYKLFLKHFHHPRFFGMELKGLYPAYARAPDLLPASDDIVAHSRLNLHPDFLHLGEVPFMEGNDCGIFFFRCVPVTDEGESSSQVYRCFGHDMEKEILAPSFIAFLSRCVVESD